MKTTIEFLNAVKAKYHLPSDGKLALKLGHTRSSVSLLLQGKNYLGDDAAMNVADLLEIDPAYVVACIHAERAKQSKEKKLWERIATMASSGAVAVILSWTVLPQISIESITKPVLFLDGNIHYANLVEYLWILIPLIIVLLLAFPWHNSPKK